MTKDRIALLAKHLGCGIKNISETTYGTCEYGSEEYLVLTDNEADERVAEDIEQSLWAFNASFLNSHFVAQIPEKYLTKMQEEMCEDCNEVFKALIKDFDHFVNDAVCSDGRGHFLAGYDGEEIELGNNLYAYRIN